MIFVTVGSQEPFDRLIRAVDEWARSRVRTDVFAQVASSTFNPQHIKFTHFIDPLEFKRVMQETRVIVAHAGMGSIISALELGKPIVVMPRRADLRETRNDHQVATAAHFGAQGRIIVATDERDLPAKLDHALSLRSTERIQEQASDRLMETIRAFLQKRELQLDPPVGEDQKQLAASRATLPMRLPIAAPKR